jgi:hypothetical protein
MMAYLSFLAPDSSLVRHPFGSKGAEFDRSGLYGVDFEGSGHCPNQALPCISLEGLIWLSVQ